MLRKIARNMWWIVLLLVTLAKINNAIQNERERATRYPVQTVTPTPRIYPTPRAHPTVVIHHNSYIVQPGDTLARIATFYGTTAQAICAFNQLPDCNLVHPGQELFMPEESWRAWLPTATSILPTSLPPTPTGVIPTPTPTLSRCPKGCAYLPPGCYFKGEIRRMGDEIYYVLLDLTHWSKREIAERGLVTLDPPNERWFCTEEEAVANGWWYWPR